MDERGAAFLARVRASREAGGGRRVPAPAHTPVAGPAPAGTLRETFVAEARAVEAQVRIVSSEGACREQVLAILDQISARRVVRASTALLESLELDAELSSRGVSVQACDLRLGGSRRESLRAAASEADVGLSEADYAIAETGTLVFWHRPGQGRVLSLLPPVHVAVLRQRDLVADLSVLSDRLAAEGRPLPSAITFVTGPSRTADIEMVITRGVHGPGALHLVLIAEG